MATINAVGLLWFLVVCSLWFQILFATTQLWDRRGVVLQLLEKASPDLYGQIKRSDCGAKVGFSPYASLNDDLAKEFVFSARFDEFPGLPEAKLEYQIVDKRIKRLRKALVCVLLSGLMIPLTHGLLW